MEIELRSEEFQEIVEQSPRWMIRSGISLVLGLLLLLLAGSYFFKYPDVIETKITLSADPRSLGYAKKLATAGADLQSAPFNQGFTILLANKISVNSKPIRLMEFELKFQ